jgi:hypothetical protein
LAIQLGKTAKYTFKNFSYTSLNELKAEAFL